MKNNFNCLAINGGVPVIAGGWDSPHRFDEREIELLQRALANSNWSNGELVAEFEKQFAKFCGVEYAVLVVNATIALKMALLSSGVREGSQVIVPGMTWPSVIIAVVECGAIPVPVDLDPESYSMTGEAIRESCTPDTRAIVATHLFNSQTDVDSFFDFANQNGITIIEDAAHSLGTKRRGKMIGTAGDIGVFSFNDKKMLAAGEGGCLVTNSESIFNDALSLREINLSSNRRPRHLMATAKISEFQAAILISQLEKLPIRISNIEKNERLLRENISQIHNISPLKQLEDLESASIYNFCFRVLNRVDGPKYRAALSAELNFPVGGAYPPVNLCPALNPLERNEHYENVKRSLNISLPICERADAWESVRFHHSALLGDYYKIDKIANAINKVSDLF